MKKVIWLLLFQLVHGCSVLAPDHTFENIKPHSYAPGSSVQDSSVVMQIMRLNGIPFDNFTDIAKVGSDNRVYELNLSGLGIDTLPQEIGRLGALKKCLLSYNRLCSLPDSITQLSIFGTEVSIRRYSDEYVYTYVNQLTISHNYLCHVSSAVALWIDKQFSTTNYLMSDSTQQCQ